jgi:phosphoglycolate phosphatase
MPSWMPCQKRALQEYRNDGDPEARNGKERVLLRTLILFDIDGTLVTGGPAKGAFRLALQKVYGTTGPIDGWEFSGKTDPQIARELLDVAGLTSEEIDDGLPVLWEVYLDELERRMESDPTRILPGVVQLLDGLDRHSDTGLGLLTGNVAKGAELKLGAVGLANRFSVGAFGSDNEMRNALPAVAVQRASEAWNVSFEPGQVVVVGDTARDVECGRHLGARTLGVATGRFRPEVLMEAGADVVVENLEDTERVLEVLLT